MKKPFLFLLSILLIGCSNNANESSYEEIESIQYDYQDVEDSHIIWDELLNFDDQYLVYIYSVTCGHCNQIKQDILSFYFLNKVTMYFVSYDKSIPVISSPETNIGKGNIEEIGIAGTPTLFEIKDKIIINCFTGTNEIIHTLTNNF